MRRYLLIQADLDPRTHRHRSAGPAHEHRHHHGPDPLGQYLVVAEVREMIIAVVVEMIKVVVRRMIIVVVQMIIMVVEIIKVGVQKETYYNVRRDQNPKSLAPPLQPKPLELLSPYLGWEYIRGIELASP